MVIKYEIASEKIKKSCIVLFLVYVSSPVCLKSNMELLFTVTDPLACSYSTASL